MAYAFVSILLKVVNSAIVDGFIKIDNLFAFTRCILDWGLPRGINASPLSFDKLFTVGVHKVTLVLE